jgi:type I restriction enzyme S subunit
MNKNSKNKLVPKLRFPEFASENWNRKTIDEICEILNNLRKPLTSNLREKGEYPYYGASGIIDYVKEYIFNERLLLIGEDGAKWVAYEKTAFIAEGKYWVNNHAHVLKPIGVVDAFLENYLVRLDISPFITGAAPPKLTLRKLKSIPVPIPENRNEQQKIASCLSSLDEVITAESEKLEALKEHKKGLLQNLFPQEGETVPKVRFKEFMDSGMWVEKIVENYFDVGSSKRVLQQDWTNQGVPFYRTRELVSLSKNEPFGSEVYISEELYSELKKTYGVPNEGDFLVSGVGTLGICYQVKNNNKFYFKDGNVLWFKLLGELNSTYFKYCFQSDHIQNQIIGQTSKSTVGTYTIQNAKKTKLWYPPRINEQEKIAEILSSIDDLIIAQNQKVETLKLHKKGLLQGLFPEINIFTNE